MIRNGYARHLRAQAERARLLQRWETLPTPVRQGLHILLRDYGLQAAQLATQTVEAFAPQHHPHHSEKGA
jgi:hypothetical protein